MASESNRIGVSGELKCSKHLSLEADGLYKRLLDRIVYDDAAELHNCRSFGDVAGTGITFKKRQFELSQQLRHNGCGE